jgi:hypothetical protein
MSEDTKKNQEKETGSTEDPKATDSTKEEARVAAPKDPVKHAKKIKNVRDVIIESIECEPGVEGCTADPDTCPNGPNVCDKKLSMFGYYDDTITESVEHVISKSMDEMTKVFSASSRRWELIIYPSLFAFILLAAYGFFLIYSLTQDIHVVSQEMVIMRKSMQNIDTHVASMSGNVSKMTYTIEAQAKTIHEMNGHMRNMTMSLGRMTHDMSIMNDSVSRPMQFMNDFMPW